jgi:hypothetical protein
MNETRQSISCRVFKYIPAETIRFSKASNVHKYAKTAPPAVRLKNPDVCRIGITVDR